jgi:hypothetical protein
MAGCFWRAVVDIKAGINDAGEAAEQPLQGETAVFPALPWSIATPSTPESANRQAGAA